MDQLCLGGWPAGWLGGVAQTNLDLRNERIVLFRDKFHRSRIVFKMVGK